MKSLLISGTAKHSVEHVPNTCPPPPLEPASPKKRRKKMPFEKEMDHFFIRNCYSEPDRGRVRACTAYQFAALKDDMIGAQEIATRLIEAR